MRRVGVFTCGNGRTRCYAGRHSVGDVHVSAWLVAVASGRRLNLFCIGHGEPTVVFESRLGDDSLVWRFVQGQIGATTRACSYDRAGYEFSDPAGRGSDATNTISDLHALLLAAEIVHPIVLVGHSIGGLYATLYAQGYFTHSEGEVRTTDARASRAADSPLD